MESTNNCKECEKNCSKCKEYEKNCSECNPDYCSECEGECNCSYESSSSSPSSSPANFLESMMSKLDGIESKTEPMNGLFSMLQNMMKDNKEVIQNVFNATHNANVNMDFLKNTNLECLSVRQHLSLTSLMANSDDELKASAEKLNSLLTPENYETNKNLPEVLTEIKTYRKHYLQMVANIFQKQMDEITNEIANNDSQEFAVTEILELGKRISINK